MIDLSLAASPPAQIRPAVTKFSPPKSEEVEPFAVDFEKALKAKEKELREADASRTAPAASHQKPAHKLEHSPKTGSQGELRKVEAAGREEIKPPEDEAQDTGTEPANGTGQSLEAGAAALQPQTQAAAPAQAAVKTPEGGDMAIAQGGPALQASTSVAAAQTMGPIASGADLEKAPAAGTVPVEGLAAPVDPALTAQTANGGNAGMPAAFAQVVQEALKTSETTVTEAVVPDGEVKTQVDPAQLSAGALAAKAAKAGENTEEAVNPGAAQTGSSAAVPTVVAQNVEVKAVGGSILSTDAQAASAARPLEMIEQVARTIEASLQQGKNSLRLQLNPADLGAIDIRLVSSGHRVSMTVIAEQASTGRLLESQVEQLRQNLADAGVQLSQVHVGQQNQSGQFSRNFAQQQPQANLAAARLGQQGLSDDTETAADRSARLRGAGTVDYKV